MKLVTRCVPILAAALALAACDLKPLAQLPSLGGEKPKDTSDRELPGGKTLAKALTLLNTRSTKPAELDAKRQAFERKITVLVPSKKDREEMGFDRVIGWHDLYTKRLAAHQRALASHRKQLLRFLKPARGTYLEIDDAGLARTCTRRAVEKAPPVLKLPAPAGGTAPGGKGAVDCRRVPGFPRMAHEIDALGKGVDSLLEAERFLSGHLGRLHARLDPEGFRGPAPEPRESVDGVRPIAP